MKKMLCLGVALTFVSACATFDPDLDRAALKRAESRAEVRTEIGCQFTDDHDAYRRCVLATYHNNKPKTYTTSQDCEGKPLAIVSDAEITCNATQTKTVITETVVTQPTPVVAQVPVVAQPTPVVAQPTPVVTQSTPVVSHCSSPNEPCYYQAEAVYEAEVQPKPCPTCTPEPVVVHQPKIVTVEKVEKVVEKPVEVVPMPQPLPEKTWWETYQEEKQPAQPKVVCPCPDPNDPCPQCVTK